MEDFKNARINAGHSQVQAAVFIGVGPNMIVNLEAHGQWPKSPAHIKAVRDYIKKYRGDK